MSGPARKSRIDESWKDEAACLDDWDLFFGPDGSEVSAAQEAAAKRICDGCDVRIPCWQYATERNERHGVWSGENREKIRARSAAV